MPSRAGSTAPGEAGAAAAGLTAAARVDAVISAASQQAEVCEPLTGTSHFELLPNRRPPHSLNLGPCCHIERHPAPVQGQQAPEMGSALADAARAAARAELLRRAEEAAAVCMFFSC